MNTFGTLFRLTTFGESHGEAIGGVVDGMPAGIDIDVDFIQQELNRRRPGQSSITTSRQEADQVELLSGVFEGKSTGCPIGFTIEYKKKLNESDDELLQLGIVELRERFGSKAKEIIVPQEVDVELENVTFTIPQRGDKKTLLDLSIMNGKQYKFDRLKQAEKLNPEQKQTRLMKELQDKLHLPKLPYQIECFDNSNISGTDAVAACVVFKALKPSKKDYKHYNIIA